MSDAPTPETDAMCICTLHKSFKATGGVVTPDFARRLERERDEWKAKYIQQNKDLGCEMMDPAGTIWDYASATQRENVQLKREVERERALANEAIATWKKTREERDKALEALAAVEGGKP
jgi:hypothetical protein